MNAPRWWVNLPVGYKGVFVIALPMLAVVAMILVRALFSEQQQATTALLARSADVRARAQELLVALLDVETAANGFALTGDRTFLEPYDAARAQVPVALRALRTLVAPGTEQDLYNRVSRHALRRLDLAAGVVTVAEHGNLSAESLKTRLGQGKLEMDEFREALGTLLETQQAAVAASEGELARLRQRLVPIIWVTFIGGFVGAAVGMWLFIAGVSRRMAAVERNAERLAQGVPLRREISRGLDEIGRLDRALRRASIQIRTRDRELRSLNTSLERSLHDTQILNRELEAFSYSVSHDLRAPLRSIDGFAQALREDWGDRLDEAGQDHLSRVRNAAQRMGRLIDDLLKLSRLSRAQIQKVDVDLTQIAREIAAELQERNPTRKVNWEIADDLRANCDPALARILLENLLGNAWKFTSKTASPCIEFCTVPVPDTRPTTFMVRDNGAGFDMKFADKLFAPFQRLHTDREFPGTGIGLATVQRIVHKHGGDVKTRAEVGRGAAFYFTFEPTDGVAAA